MSGIVIRSESSSSAEKITEEMSPANRELARNPSGATVQTTSRHFVENVMLPSVRAGMRAAHTQQCLRICSVAGNLFLLTKCQSLRRVMLPGDAAGPVLQSSGVYLCTAECVTVWLHAGPVSPASTDSADSKATVIRSGSGTSSSIEEESLPSPAVTPSVNLTKAANAASPGSSDSGSYQEEDVLTSTDAEAGNKSKRAFDAASPTSVDSIFDMTPGSPPSLGLGSPFAAGSPLSLSALDDFDDLLIDEDGFEAISPLPALTAAASSPPRQGTMTLAVFQSPPHGITTAWAIGQTPTSAGSNAGTGPRRNSETYTDTMFSPLPLVGRLAAQRLPADGAMPTSPLQLMPATYAAPPEGVNALFAVREPACLAFICGQFWHVELIDSVMLNCMSPSCAGDAPTSAICISPARHVYSSASSRDIEAGNALLALAPAGVRALQLDDHRLSDNASLPSSCCTASRRLPRCVACAVEHVKCHRLAYVLLMLSHAMHTHTHSARAFCS